MKNLKNEDFDYVFQKIDEESKKHGFKQFSDLTSIKDEVLRNKSNRKKLNIVFGLTIIVFALIILKHYKFIPIFL